MLTPVAAREDGQLDLVDVLVFVRRGLGAAERTFNVRTADVELVMIGRPRLEATSFDLGRGQ